jgi:hypothetical protein
MELYSEDCFSFEAAYSSGWSELERMLVGMDEVKPISQKCGFSFLIRKSFNKSKVIKMTIY